MAMSAKVESDFENFMRKIRGVSREFANAAAHLSQAYGDQFQRAVKAVHNNNETEALSILDGVKNSPVVQGFAGRLVAVREKVSEIGEIIRQHAGPLAQIVIGLTMVAAGALGMAQLGALIATLLILAGICFAMRGAWAMAKNAMVELGAVN